MFPDPFAPPKRGRKPSSPFDLVTGSSTSTPARDKRRAFTRVQKNEIWAQQKGKCAKCHKPLDPRTTEYDHGKAWADGGKTTIKNGRALCANCHKLKTHKDRLKKVESKKQPPKPTSPFDFGPGPLNGSSRKNKKDPFDIGF